MAFFGGRASMLEVQNRALIKTAGERAQRIGELEGELQQAGQMSERLKAEMERLKAEMERLKLEREAEMKRLKAEMERLKLEREFYYKRALALEQDLSAATEAAAKYSLWARPWYANSASSIPLASGSASSEFGP
jgi:chromosome segregation ATPase